MAWLHSMKVFPFFIHDIFISLISCNELVVIIKTESGNGKRNKYKIRRRIREYDTIIDITRRNENIDLMQNIQTYLDMD